ncbi:hypothetical protein AJ80_03433 [Polytolypa hystricis UAMH7299]|uniref:Protein-arginine deiminase C-terminal domain-containing protein n=1 Tax=Polytolypa hystricis (strain UAMH7299) TaxID=1447883 RepID=A0A2B7YGY8_POLH7|nr:hypothetical protein AJ80_03433 [Polytolypa hystricis UAMH7299]
MRYVHCLLHALILCNSAVSFRVDRRAGSNRDGVVDIDGDSDLLYKHEWSNAAGAIFLANIGDTNCRCSKLALQGPPPSNEELSACHDAADDIQRAPQFMAPILGTIRILDPTSRKNVRIFHREDTTWIFTPNNHTFLAEELRNGLELGIDARDVCRPGVWDGIVTVQFDIQDGLETATDSVNLRVSPLLTYDHTQPAVEMITTAGNDSFNFFQERFVTRLQTLLDKADIHYPLFQFNMSDDLWPQDFLEPGYTSMPGPEGPVSLQVMIRSAQDERVVGRQIFEYLRVRTWCCTIPRWPA